ncbi:MAG: class I SAM-dependent methyltransferase [Candidatus Pacebacteria bacterium]|nr:class I SAM-dependent methyltransferase [Candidatus Paceibacterota bacterium]
MIDNKKYYDRINKLNKVHYAAEVPYYSVAELRPVEIKLLSKLKKGSRILDLACGSGRFSIGAAKLGFKVTGLDVTPEAVKAARARAKRDKLNNVEFVEGDMTDLRFKDSTFDYTFCPRFSINAVATHDQRSKAVKQMLRVTKKSGKVFIESFNKWYLGKGFVGPIKLYVADLKRNFQILLSNITGTEYGGLLPGDVVYPANKVKGAPDGFTHLPTIFEVQSWIPKGIKSQFFSIPQIIDTGKFDLMKYFRYSIWVILKPEK